MIEDLWFKVRNRYSRERGIFEDDNKKVILIFFLV